MSARDEWYQRLHGGMAACAPGPGEHGRIPDEFATVTCFHCKAYDAVAPRREDTGSKPVAGRAPSRAIAGAGLQVAPVGRAWVIGMLAASETAVVRGSGDRQRCAAAAGAGSRGQSGGGQ